jgi:hypothetical protein
MKRRSTAGAWWSTKTAQRVRPISRNGRDHTRRFRDIAAAAKLSARSLVLDGEVAIYDQQLRSRFDWLRAPDPDAVFDAADVHGVRSTTTAGSSPGAHCVIDELDCRTSSPRTTWSGQLTTLPLGPRSLSTPRADTSFYVAQRLSSEHGSCPVTAQAETRTKAAPAEAVKAGDDWPLLPAP